MPAILQVVEMVPDKQGPVELQLAEMARQSRDRGWDFTLCFPAAPPEWYRVELEATGCTVVVVPNLNGEGRAQVLDLVSGGEPTVAHLHFVAPRHYAKALRSRGVGAVVRTEHTYLRPRSRLRTVARAWRSRGVDVTIACSRHIAEQSSREYWVPQKRLRTVLNGIDLQRFVPKPAEKQALRAKWLGFASDDYVITVAAHLIRRKRIDLLVNAFRLVRDEIPNARLVIAGDGPERENLKQLATSMGLGDDVRFLSGDNRVDEIYAASDVGALTSWGEGLPGSAMEALACGLPLVSTATPGLDEVAEHGVSGFIVGSDAAAVADPLIHLGQHPGRRSEMGLAARQRALASFDVERAARETMDVYEELLSLPNGVTSRLPLTGSTGAVRSLAPATQPD